MSWTHIIVTLVIFAGIVLVFSNADELPHRYIQIENWETLETFETTNSIILVSIITLLFAQCILIFNICRRRKPNS